METLADRYAARAVRSVFIYTREAHPGENYRHHTSMDGKRRNGQAFREHCRIRRPILLDDLEGSAHHAYGLLPNMTWIIGRGGFIHYKSAWTSPNDAANALESILDFQANRAKQQWVPFYSERSAWSSRDQAKFKEGLLRAGPQAVADYERMLLKSGAARSAPSEDMGPRVPGNFYKTEEESRDK
ncbi:MAG: hypothetical protein HY646_10700 [Acidobacteria bacterium]|nr:hypothetical protein [Acidobacteriota bacterium]